MTDVKHRLLLGTVAPLNYTDGTVRITWRGYSSNQRLTRRVYLSTISQYTTNELDPMK